jgi:hypothetical protein
LLLELSDGSLGCINSIFCNAPPLCLLVRTFGLLVRAFGLLVRAFGLLVRAFGLLVRAFGLLVRAFGLLVRRFSLLVRTPMSQVKVEVLNLVVIIKS